MAVETHPVHEKVKHSNVSAGCKNLSREQKPYIVSVKLYDQEGNYVGEGTQSIQPVMSVLCHNTGQYTKDENGSYSWKEYPECEGCNPINRDWLYINKMRSMVEKEVRSYQLRI